MQTHSVSDWMRSFGYGLPIHSRPARTAARHYRTIVGLLVVTLLALHLGYLLLISPDCSRLLAVLLLCAVVVYIIYLRGRIHLPERWEKHYYRWWPQLIRAEIGILGTAGLVFAYAYFDQPHLLWPLFLLPLMIISEHVSTPMLMAGWAEVAVFLVGADWFSSQARLLPFLASPYAFAGLGRALTMALFSFLMHYTMRNLDARDKRIEQLHGLFTQISRCLRLERDPGAIRQKSLDTLVETVSATCGVIWRAPSQSDLLDLWASAGAAPCLGENSVSHSRRAGPKRQDLPAAVIRTGQPRCAHRTRGKPSALKDALVDDGMVFADTVFEVGVPLHVFQPHRPASVAVLVLGFTRSVGEAEMYRLFVTTTEIADVLSPIFYYASLVEEHWALRDLGQTVSRSLDRRTVIGTLLDQVTTTLGFDFATVSLVDKNEQVIRTVGGRHVDEEWIQTAAHSLNSGDIQADIVRTGNTEVLKGWDPRFDRAIWEKFGHERMVRIFVPMTVTDKETGDLRHIGTVETGYWDAGQAEITPEQADLLKPFVNQAAVALYKAELYAEAQRRAAVLEHLHTVGNAIQQAVWSLPRLMQEIGNNAMEILGADIVLLYGFGRDTSTIDLLHTAGEVQGPNPLALRLGEGNILDWIIAHRKPFYTGNAQTCPELVGYGPSESKPNKYRTFTQRQQVQAFAGIPLMAGERLIGIMCVNYRHKHYFAEENRYIIDLFAQQAAVALENARLKELDRENVLAKARNHFARELHDAVVGDLCGVGLKLSARLQNGHLPPELERELTQILELAEHANSQIGFLVAELTAPPASQQDFRQTIQETADRAERYFGLKVARPTGDLRLARIPALGNVALAHVAKESFTNSIRHAEAQCITVRCWMQEPENQICLAIEDDGVGFDPQCRRSGGHGLKNMHEYIQEAGGLLQIDSAPGQGTRIVASIPTISSTGRPEYTGMIG